MYLIYSNSQTIISFLFYCLFNFCLFLACINKNRDTVKVIIVYNYVEFLSAWDSYQGQLFVMRITEIDVIKYIRIYFS